MAVNAHAIWFQLGVTDPFTNSIATKVGQIVVMDAYPKGNMPALGRSSMTMAT